MSQLISVAIATKGSGAMHLALVRAASACWPWLGWALALALALALARTLKDLEEAKADLASAFNNLEDVKKKPNRRRSSIEVLQAQLLKPTRYFSSDATAKTAMDQLRDQQWQQLPAKIILLRHGQAEHNLDPSILREDSPNRKPDNLCELTSLGRSQAQSAGERIRKLLGNDGVISVIVSPFERTQQTLYALQQELGDVKVRRVHIDSRVREQEFGNYQRDMDQLRKEANEARRSESLGCWIRTAIY